MPIIRRSTVYTIPLVRNGNPNGRVEIDLSFSMDPAVFVYDDNDDIIHSGAVKLNDLREIAADLVSEQ